MNNLKTPLSIKVIYWFTSISFWLYVVVSVFALLLAGSLILNLFGASNLHVGVPVSVDLIEKGELHINGITSSVQFVEMQGKLKFDETPVVLKRYYGVSIIVIISLFFFIFYKFKQFIDNVYKGIYFDISNIALLKKVSYGIAGTWLFVVFYSYFQYFFVFQKLKFNTIEIIGDVQTYPIILFVALFIWVLSHVFTKGVELQEEAKLII